MKTDHYRVCVIGAGPSGLTTIKNLLDAGISDIICHEAFAESGGIWAYSEEPERPSVYESAHTISSRQLSQFSDFPMPASYPDYPSNRQILDYMRGYEAHFDLDRYIRFGSRAEKAEKRNDGGWLITTATASGTLVHTADYLVVCSGHHRKPYIPELPGDFSGEQSHSGRFKKAQPYAGKKVLVVGAGNSGCDIAVAVSRVADHVSLSMRNPQVIVQKFVAGRPVDVQYAKLQRFSQSIRDVVLRWCVRLSVGPYARYGLPEPDFPILSRHPTLNTDILEQIRHGKVMPRQGIERAEGHRIHFADGSEGEFDAIIWATGFEIEVPFLGDICAGWERATQLPLYLKMMLADEPRLSFVGLIQPIGCIWVLAELQAKLIAREVAGKWKRPADMAGRIARQLRIDGERYKESPRHALQVDFHEYRAELEANIAQARS